MAEEEVLSSGADLFLCIRPFNDPSKPPDEGSPKSMNDMRFVNAGAADSLRCLSDLAKARDVRGAVSFIELRDEEEEGLELEHLKDEKRDRVGVSCGSSDGNGCESSQ